MSAPTPNTASTDQRTLVSDGDQISRFVAAAFKYADAGTFVSLRAFDQFRRDVPPVFIRPIELTDDLGRLAADATFAATDAAIKPISVVFAPPVATFLTRDNARTDNLANGLMLTVEIDTTNPTEGKKRLEGLLGPATIVVASGGDWVDEATGEVIPKLHLHWLLSEPTRDPESHEQLRHARVMATSLIGADPTGTPVVHCFRWPGSWHTKSTPRLASIVSLDDSREIHLVDAVDALEAALEAAGMAKAEAGQSGDPEAPLEVVADAAAKMPNDDLHYDDWIRRGYAFYRATGGQGFALFDEWSAKSAKYNAKETEVTWRRIAASVAASDKSASPNPKAGAGTIFYHASQAGWERKSQFKMFNTTTQEAASGRPTIKLVAGELHTAATEAERAIIESGIPIYQRGKSLVRPIRKEVPASRGRTTIAAGFGEQGTHGLIDVLCEVSEWIRFDARTEDWVRCNPSSQVANILLSREGRWAFPPVAGVITTPTLRPDGTILSEEGYDAATRLYHVADPTVRLHPAVHAPSRVAAEGALKALSALLDEFPFVSMDVDGAAHDVARAVALSALITPVVRGALTVAPLHAFRANTAGTGKSYLVDVASAISTGRPCPAISAAPEEAETEKRIAGLLLSGYPLVNIDNVNGELGGDLLCQAVERPLVRIRRLGGSDIFEIESRATITATGNQLRVVGDMVRRTLICDLDAKQERPELRQFKGDPVATVLADRGRYISAALVIVGAYLVEGQPNKLPALASFQDWSDLVRSALVWLGCADPVLSMEAARENDPELGELREMLVAWSGSIGVGVGVTAKEAADKASEHKATPIGRDPEALEYPELQDALMRVAGERGEINMRRLGRWLLNREGRIVDGLRFERMGSAQGGVVRWGVAATGASR